MILAIALAASSLLPAFGSQQGEPFVLHLHDLGDLVWPEAEEGNDSNANVKGAFSDIFPAPNLLPTTTPGSPAQREFGGGQGFAKVEDSFPFDSYAELLHMVKTYMEPPFGESGGNITVQDMDGKWFLISNLSASQDSWLAQFLAYQRERNSSWRGGLTVTIYRGDSSDLEYLNAMDRIEILSSPESVEERGTRLLDNRFEVIHQSQLSLLPRVESNLGVTNETKYVGGWSLVSVEPGPSVIEVPSIKAVKVGTKINARVYRISEEDFVVSLQMEYKEIRRPIPVKVDILEGENGPISKDVAQPVLDTTFVEGDLRMTSGSGVQIFTPSNGGGKDTVMVLWFEKRTDGVINRISPPPTGLDLR
ncbi:MAG: hypothetical protein QM477_12010 [Planctomycetota bacterium]